MTEREWLTCRDPIAMLNDLGVAPDDRKAVLLVLAYLDRIWGMTVPSPIRDWAEQARLAVEGRGDPATFRASEEEACHYIGACGPGYLREGISPWACEALAGLFFFAQAEEDEWEPATEPEQLAEMAIQADHVRDIFGNPFRPATVDLAWLIPKVVDLARFIDEDRAFDRMPELADALEEAGCIDAEMLSHCRSRADHVRGCWVIDAILGKT